MSDLVFDNAEFARRARTLSGTLDATQLLRVADAARFETPVHFALAGNRDALGRGVIDLRLEGRLQLECQRCLSAMPFDLNVSVRFTVFESEAALDAAEADDDDLEGLLAERAFDALGLIEDEILLTLPFAPTHEACATQVPAEGAEAPKKPNPFAVLAMLKGKLQSGE
jgi:uncharacterized protein